MNKLTVCAAAMLLSALQLAGQGVRVSESPGDPDPSAGFEVDFQNRGFLPPRMSSEQRDALVNPADGLMIFNTTTGCPEYCFSGEWYTQCGNPVNPPFVCGTDTASDADNNSYTTVQIGTQCWLQQSLNTTKYANGDAIPEVTGNSAWAALSDGAWSHYGNVASNSNTYGRLYNYFAATDERGICPVGWHIPTETDWVDLEVYLGMPSGEINNTGFRGTTQGGAIKQTGTTLWLSPNTAATNSTGFTALPTGGRGNDGTYYFINQGGDMWSSTESTSSDAYYRSTYYENGGIWRGAASKKYGFSIRCMKD